MTEVCKGRILPLHLGTLCLLCSWLPAAAQSPLSGAGVAIQEWQATDSLEMAMSFNRLGTAAGNRGDMEQAALCFERALEIWHKLVPQSLEVAKGLNNLGVVARYRGDLELAADYLHRALEIRQQLAPDSADVAANLVNLGSIAFDRGHLGEAGKFFERALEIQQQLAPGSVPMATSLSNLGTVAERLGEPERAIGYYERSLAIRRQLAPGSVDVARSFMNLGFTHQVLGHPELAAGFLERALAIQQRLAPDSADMANTLHGLGTLYRQKQEPRRALGFFGRAIEAFEIQVDKLGGSRDAHAGFRARYADLYRDTLELELELGSPESAFHTLERYRARSFLALLAERDTVLADEIPEELAELRRHVAARYEGTQRRITQLHPEKDAARIEDLRRELRELRQEAGAIAARIRRSSPRLAALRYPEPLELGPARQALDPGTVLLSYSVGHDKTHLFVLTQADSLRVETLALGADELRADVELFQKLIPQALPGDPFGDVAFDRLRETGRRLYLRLIGPAADSIAESERILILPDGPLHLLAFGALTRKTGGEQDQYLAEWKPLHLALSATVYAELRKPPPTGVSGSEPRFLLAAFGDPRYPQEPAWQEDSSGIPDLELRSASDRGLLDWRDLPYTRREVERIAALYPSQAVHVSLGPEATEERVKSFGREAHILHIAAHGYLDERVPMDSFVALTLPQELTAERDNGLLQAWEIFEQVRLAADLVVLSACQSGRGRELGGEGVIGLTRAFQYAGARSVAAALWSVPDRTTSELMVRFHRHLRAGESKDVALQAAQVELIRGPIRLEDDSGRSAEIDASAPYYWAAFQIYGDWRPPAGLTP